MRVLLFLICLASTAVMTAQTTTVNLGLDEGEPGQTPPGWLVPQVLRDRGDRAEVRRQGCFAGAGCAVLLRPDTPAANSFGNLMQAIDATPFRGKRILFRAAVRVEALDAEGRGQLWFRVDLSGGGMGFFDNMQDRPIRSTEWKTYEISGDIDLRAAFINFGAMAIGKARVWLDAVSLEVAGEAVTPKTDGPEVAAAREAIGKLYARLDSAYERGEPDVLLSVALPGAQAGNALQKTPITAVVEEWKKLIASGAKLGLKSEITALSLSGAEATVGVRQMVTITANGRTQNMDGTAVDKWVRLGSDWKLRESVVSSAAEKQAPTDPETVKRVAAELRKRAAPLTTAEAGNPYQDLAAFGKAVGDARVVALGEATHGTREIFQMKHRLLEYLVKEKGFTVFAIEANWPESLAVDSYIKTGEGDPRKALAGMYFWTWQTEEVLAMVEWMRAYNQAAGGRPQVSFTSFDMQTYAVALERVVDYVKRNAPADLSTVEASYKVLRELATP